MSYGPYGDPGPEYQDGPKPYDSAPPSVGAPSTGYPPAAPPSPYGPNPYGPNPYGQQPFGGPPPPPQPTGTNSLCVVSLVTAIAAWAICPGVLALVAVVTGIMGRSQTNVSGEDGEGLAIAGLIIGGINLFFSVIGFLFFVLFLLGFAVFP